MRVLAFTPPTGRVSAFSISGGRAGVEPASGQAVASHGTRFWGAEENLAESFYRRIRQWLAPVHPNRLRAVALHTAHRLGWHHVALWGNGLRPRRLLASYRWCREVVAMGRRRREDPRLKVAVDISPFWEPLTGIGWYLYRLLEALAERDDLVLRLYGPSFIDKGDQPPPVVELPRGPALELVQWQVPTDFSVVYYHFADWLRRRAHRLIDRDGNQLLFAPNYFLPPPFDRCQGRLVATIHDLSVYVVPETLRDSTRAQLLAHLEGTLRRASLLLTDAEAVRQELLTRQLAAPERVRAIHLAPASLVGVTPGARPAGLPERYVLFVGTLEPRKNLAMLLEVFPRQGPLRLVICGGLGWKADELREKIAVGVAEGWLVALGYLPEAELAAVYHGAEWLVLPSLYEGFGLPAVEAMACGIPVLLADLPVLRELVGEAGLYADPHDLPAWQALLARAADRELRARQAAAARSRAAAFDWRHTAEATAAAFFVASGQDFGRTSPSPRSAGEISQRTVNHVG